MALDVSGDYAVIDNTETVTYYQRATQSTFSDTPITVTNALRRVTTREQLESAGASLKSVSLTWHIWKGLLGANVIPKNGDVIQDSSGLRWTVIKIDGQTWGTRWVLTTIKELTATA